MKEFLIIISSIVIAVLLVVFVVVAIRPPYEVRMQRKAEKNWYMPNDEIIAETKKCEESGLRATEENDYLGDKLGWRITGITCRPIKEEVSKSSQKIKKSNITEVNVVIPEVK